MKKFYHAKETGNEVLTFDDLCNRFNENRDESFESWFCSEVGENYAALERRFGDSNEDETDLLNHIFCFLSAKYGNKKYEVRRNPGVQSKHPSLRDCRLYEVDDSEIEEG